MNSIILLFAVITFLSTLIGGLIILRFRNSLHYFFAFAAGTLMAVSFLDLIPESISLAGVVGLPIRYIMITVVLSFFIYSLIERYFLTHDLEECDHCHNHDNIMGPIGAGSLILHSFFDGLAIGASFQISISVGLVVALAVIFHDFTDGINTVSIMLKNKQNTRKAFIFLIMDALAPVLGVLSVSLFVIPQSFLAYILAFFAGEFIYIGASSLLPETRKYPSKKIILAMAFGILLILFLTSFLKF
jgi:ZIP family zinc transporter